MCDCVPVDVPECCVWSYDVSGWTCGLWVAAAGLFSLPRSERAFEVLVFVLAVFVLFLLQSQRAAHCRTDYTSFLHHNSSFCETQRSNRSSAGRSAKQASSRLYFPFLGLLLGTLLLALPVVIKNLKPEWLRLVMTERKANIYTLLPLKIQNGSWSFLVRLESRIKSILLLYCFLWLMFFQSSFTEWVSKPLVSKRRGETP